MEYLYEGKKSSKLEKEYRHILEKASLTDKQSNGMYINTLLRRFMIDSGLEGYLRDWDYADAKKKIIDYMQTIINDVKERYNLSRATQIKIQEWEKSLGESSKEVVFDVSNIESNVETDNKIKDYILNTVNKIKKPKYKFDTDITKTKFNIDEKENEKTGSIGEDIVYKYLVSEYGIDNVYHASRINKYSHYDISVKHKDGSVEYIEVKSSTKPNNINWYISRREFEFYKQNKDSYSIIFVKNIFISDDPKNLAIVEKIKNPIISVSKDKIGFENGVLIISPIKYIGLA